MKGLGNYKPVSVPVRAAAILLGRPLLTGSSNLPGSRTERAAPPPLFGLAPHGVYPAGANCFGRGALLPHLFTLTSSAGFWRLATPRLRDWRYILCGTFRETRFERVPPAVSRHAALWRPDFPPRLHREGEKERLPVREALLIIRRGTAPGNILLKQKGAPEVLSFGMVYSGDISPECIVGGSVCARPPAFVRSDMLRRNTMRSNKMRSN